MAAQKQQSSSLMKLLIIGGVLVAVVLLFPSGEAPKTGKTPPKQFSGSAKKGDALYTKADEQAQFKPIDASLKNSFVPLVSKKDPNGPAAKNGIPADFAGGEATWVYTGNMSVDGTPNALLENTASGDGVFIRPNQHWKNLKLVSVAENSILVEGPGGVLKTVYFEDSTLTVSEAPLSPLPPASLDGSANPANTDGRNRRNRQNNGQFADTGGLSGPIGQDNSFAPALNPQDQQGFQTNSRRSQYRGN